MDEHYEFRQYPDGPFDGDDYIPSKKLAVAVNTALAAEQPLLVTGEPGTGKTRLAESVARRLRLGEVLTFVARSDHHARDCLYTFDSLRRLHDAQVQSPLASSPANYVRYAALGEAIRSPAPRVVLIDEIDKAPRDFPNDLLGVLEGQLRFPVHETGETIVGKEGVRPFVIITSNREQPLPHAFLRRCVFHHIEFPNDKELGAIVRSKYTAAQISDGLLAAVLKRFREVHGSDIEKRPATGELLAWVKVLLRAKVTEADVLEKRLSELYPGVLLKLDEDFRRVLGATGDAKRAGSAAR
ncbi:AAA family ATPase [Sorangium sp. So ce861]|uniref:AAA family ATPase n=1 Tax=Sorangium sp. So ce861 TaxID=3133323 RepID=UPI003F5FEC66